MRGDIFIVNLIFFKFNQMTCHLNGLSGAQKGEWLLRWAMGLFMLVAGMGKIMGGLSMFVANMSGGFAESFLPMALVTGFFYLVPFIEILLGLMLLLSWKRECALWTTGVLMIVFLFGHLAKGDMGNISSIMIYIMVVAGALTLPAAWNLGCCGKCEK